MVSDIWSERNFKARKWTNGWTAALKNPLPDSTDPMIQAKNTYTKHTLECGLCSMFGLKSEAESKRNLFCSSGFKMMKRYRKIRVVWKHQHPNEFARSVVGGMLHAQDEIRKKYRRKKQDEARSELNYNK